MKIEEIPVQDAEKLPRLSSMDQLRAYRITLDAQDIQIALLESLYRTAVGTANKWNVCSFSDLQPGSDALPKNLVFLVTSPWCTTDAPFTAELQRQFTRALGKQLPSVTLQADKVIVANAGS